MELEEGNTKINSFETEENVEGENKVQNSDQGAVQNHIEGENNENPKTEKKGALSGFDMSKLDKKSMEILDETDEDDYKFKLDDFEGPLDLLVHLIKITKIDIRDIFVSTITEQYLTYMSEIETIDTDKASEFILMAATLLELKSKHLLPKPEDDSEVNAEEDFFRMVEEYKLIKEQTPKLAEIEDVDSFYKAPDNTVGQFRYELPENLSVDALISAFSNLMQKMTVRAEVVQEKKIEKERFTVAQKISQIKDKLIEKDKFMFSELFDDKFSKSEVINTFLALLEMLKRQFIKVKQTELFDDIEIEKNEDADQSNLDEKLTYDGEN